jgi:serine/threonine protein kinase
MIGTTVSHYRIIEHIGAGGMGTVYLAEDMNLKRHVALKFLPPEKTDAEAVARLIREARAASALDHPHIATVYEIGEHASLPFIAMAHYDGETVAQRLGCGPLPNADVARIVRQVADALGAAHALGIVHRDLKPSNLMLTSAGQVKVLDFGIARVETLETATQLTRAGETVGTAAYMSPEQAAGEEVDTRSDLWSLGIVAYQALTGRLPFQGTNALAIINAVLTATPAPVRSARPDVAPELEAIISRTLVRDRDRRTITAAAIRDIAAACEARLLTGEQSPVTRPRPSRRTWIAAAAATLVIVAGGMAWWAQGNAKLRWARQVALPEIRRLAGEDRVYDAYRLAEQVQPYLSDDPILSSS